MTSYLWDITCRESFPHYNIGYKKCSTLFLTITMVSCDKFYFDYFCTIGNRNKYFTKSLQTVSLQLNYVSILPGKTKNNTKTADCLCSALRWTDRSRLLQKVVQSLCLSLFVIKFTQLSSDRKIFYILMGFIKHLSSDCEMGNFNMKTTVKLSRLVTCHSYDVIKLLSN